MILKMVKASHFFFFYINHMRGCKDCFKQKVLKQVVKLFITIKNLIINTTF